jgi:hypothetical protein
MPGTRSERDKDMIARIADSSEDALRRLVDLPRRVVVQAVDEVEDLLRELVEKVREIDPLYARVAAIEKRLDALEKAQRPKRRAATRSRPARTSRPSVTPAPEPPQAGRESGPRAGFERGQGQSSTQGEGAP